MENSTFITACVYPQPAVFGGGIAVEAWLHLNGAAAGRMYGVFTSCAALESSVVPAIRWYDCSNDEPERITREQAIEMEAKYTDHCSTAWRRSQPTI